MLDCMKKTYSSEGFTGFYRGFIIGAASLFFYRGLYFGIYDTGKELLLKDRKSGIM
jgi:solute carrier family 25 (adenine nucleotide translocator) protein 4/5/6/31